MSEKVERERIRGAAYLADYPADKIIVECEQCGWRAQFDKAAMIEAGGDRPMTHLLDDIARRKGCTRVALDMNDIKNHCRARYVNIDPKPSDYAKAKGV
ncbi:hypothetical protein EN781_00015 [Mesorhizobium sp. M4A.F.Ca.ET.090.04.2.1]|uniref:hypothetical protein n=1 Tax=Mesorhizobium sp. M4A.F.Ca.ET.090.04.2.1 TaxID=2496663 RepID=UPI000FCC9882|nr:hypothetical protein [Mesorhizobium sp. M4A.F.Ca.ET.090.04.2.1]RVC47557.1 hypothetical protein EN781_00015 [Mesorhizobium sp. M4A.F.Ca.ET.090.04.2.1]